MEVVNLPTIPTGTIITSSSKKEMVCIKRNLIIAVEKAVVEL